MATQDERISELNNKIATLEKEIKKNSIADYQKRQYLRLRYLAFVEAGAFCLFMGVGKELALFALIVAAITIPAGYLIIKKESKEMQAQNDQRREIIKSLTNEKKLLEEESATPEAKSPASSATESKRFSDTPDPALTLADPARPDIIKKDYWALPSSSHFQHSLLEITGNYEGEGISINLFSGSMNMYQDVMRNNGSCCYMDRRFSSDTVTDLTVREFAKRVSEEAGEKFASFTQENWKDYIPENVMSAFEETVKSCEKPKAKEVRMPLKYRLTYDFDAYYIVSHRAQGSCMTFLRRTDSGWRAFSLSAGHFGLGLGIENNITEQKIIDCFNRCKDSSEIYICSDRKLNQKDMEYVSELMPESHPSEAIGRSFASGEKHSYNNYTAYYLKGKNWYPCANFKNIEEIYHRISTVAQYEIEYK